MADAKTVTIVPLKGSNYPTWKIQCRMALMKEGLWGIVNETEAAPKALKRKPTNTQSSLQGEIEH